MTTKEPYVARLSIKRPGAMTLKARKEIAAWLRQHATKLVRDGAGYVDKGAFHATRYER